MVTSKHINVRDDYQNKDKFLFFKQQIGSWFNVHTKQWTLITQTSCQRTKPETYSSLTFSIFSKESAFLGSHQLKEEKEDQSSKRTSIERRESDIISHGGGEINRQWERKINRRKRTGR